MSVKPSSSSTRLAKSPFVLPHPARLSPAAVDNTYVTVGRPLIVQVPKRPIGHDDPLATDAPATSVKLASPVVTQVPETPVKNPKFIVQVEDVTSAVSETEENPPPAIIAIKKTGKKRASHNKPPMQDGQGPRKLDKGDINRCRFHDRCPYQQTVWSPYCNLHACQAILEDGTQCSGLVQQPTKENRWCNGYHRENGTFDHVIEAQKRRVVENERMARERQEEMDYELNFFSQKYPILNNPEPITGPPRSRHRGSFASSSSGTTMSSHYSYEEFEKFYEDKGWGACPLVDSRSYDFPGRGNRSRSTSKGGSQRIITPRIYQESEVRTEDQDQQASPTSVTSVAMVRGGQGQSVCTVQYGFPSCPAATRNPAFVSTAETIRSQPGPATFII